MIPIAIDTQSAFRWTFTVFSHSLRAARWRRSRRRGYRESLPGRCDHSDERHYLGASHHVLTERSIHMSRCGNAPTTLCHQADSIETRAGLLVDAGLEVEEL